MTATTEPTTDSTDPAATRPFADVLLDLDGGRLHTELSTELQKLVERVAHTGKKGSISVVLTVAPSKSEAPIQVTPGVKVAMPQADRRASLFFTDDDANLVRKDPRQQELPLRDITADSTQRPVRQA